MPSSLLKTLIVLRGGPASAKGPGSGNYKHKKGSSDEYLSLEKGDYATRVYVDKRQGWRESVTPAQAKAAANYSVNESEPINNFLRYGYYYRDDSTNEIVDNTKDDVTISRTHEAIKDLYAALRPIGFNTVVYRNSSVDLSSYPVGYTFRDRGFVSTSMVPYALSTGPRYRSIIKVPKTQKVAYGSYLIGDDDAGETEIILAPNTSFKVARVVHKTDGSNNEVELEIVPSKKSNPPLGSHLKKSLVVRGGPPQHKDGTTGLGSGNWKRVVSAIDAGNPEISQPAQDLFQEKANQFQDNLSRDELKGLIRYTGFDYIPINEFLRNPKRKAYATFPPKDIRAAANTLYGMAKPISYSAVAYRGVNGTFLDGLSEGDTFKDRAFVSTSIKPQIAENTYVGFAKEQPSARFMRIVIPQGTPVLFNGSSDKEIILRPGTKFVVTGRGTSPEKGLPMLNLQVV